VLNRVNRFVSRIYSSDERLFYSRLKNILNFRPGNLKLYHTAFVHKSASKVYADGSLLNNERLEFLGDAILDAVVAEYIFALYPKKTEGFLTQLRSKIVNREMLNILSVETGISEMVVLQNPNNGYKNIYGDAFEAFIGALFLDKGYKLTKRFVLKQVIKKHIDICKLVEKETDFKSRLIEWGQKNKQEIEIESTENPSLTDKIPQFVAHIKILDALVASGTGYSKKEAEQCAAEDALTKLDKQTLLL
jgi:ribonuclease III